MDDPDKKPKRKPRKRAAKKRAPKKRAPKNNVDNDVEASYDSSLSSLSSLNSFFKVIDNNPSLKNRRLSMKTVSGNLQEHLACFILIGYTMDGDPIQMMFAPTPKDIDSLSTNLQKFILDSAGPRGL